jgi:hypothetical protein
MARYRKHRRRHFRRARENPMISWNKKVRAGGINSTSLTISG